MATQFEIDCALLAGASYISTRPDINRFPIPEGWSEVPLSHVALPSGFEAVTFTNGTEIVISFAGTGPGLNPDWIANSAMALGFSSDQLEQAALYYLQVKAANPPGTVISFTGHSLGGGLAALMGVFFDERAITFDQAPFANSATTGIRDDLVAYLHEHGYNDGQLGELAPELLSFDVPSSRSANVSGMYVQGEVLQLLPFSTLGTQAGLAQNSTGLGLLGSIDLHSQALLSAFLQNDAFRQITFKLPELLKMVFDSALYAYSTGTGNTQFVNLLEHLVRHQAGVNASLPADAMLDRFTLDLQQIAQDGGLTLTDNNLTKTLVAFAMQKYYEEQATGTDYGNTLFSDTGITGGIRFDRTDVAANLADAKGYNLYFLSYLDSLSTREREAVDQMLPTLTDWFVQAGNAPMNATASGNSAFMLGGSGDDRLTGDRLTGDAANDSNYDLERRAA